MEMTTKVTLAAIALLALAACGGGGGSSTPPPTSPTPAPTVPASSACGAITASTASASTAIVNGAECPTDGSAVVLLNVKDGQGFQLGSCSGTIVAARAILTAAHCLQPPAAGALVFLGSGAQQASASIATHPAWKASDPSSYDIGVVIMPQDIGRAAKPLLLSRDGHVGENAVVAGWGKESEFSPSATLRAGATTLSAVTSLGLQTAFSPSVSSVCQGDSGGPIFVQEGNTWAVAGVISANTTLACSSGTNYYASVRASDNMAFILGQVPDAARK
jgi:hypothetical protein